MSRADKLRPEQEEEIWRLWVRRAPRPVIARQIGCSVTTVSNVVSRVRKELNEQRLEELEEVRTEVLAEYDAVKREAWERLQRCKPSSTAAVGYMGVILEARRQQDRLLGLEQLTINHRGLHLARIEHILSSPVPIALPGADDSDREDDCGG